MSTVLDEINAGVREDMQARINSISRTRIQELAAAAPPALNALDALVGGRQDPTGTKIIAEVKRSSPSKGKLADIPEPAKLAADYEAGGASVISCLTEQRRFNGSLADFDAVRAAVNIPLLRKDFTVDEYMIYEARAHGADLILLIVAALDEAQLRDYLALTHELGMQALVETHTPDEIERAVAVDAKLMGINVRNLKTLDVDVSHYATLAALLPENVIRIAESGVEGVEQIQEYASHGADAILVGEALVKHGSPAEAVRDFRAAAAATRR
ncbi:indole-3-glycerol phosphate synthase TrpC [Micrococcoides hystricis]|uniref:Indole-3-glycerol phosphate synthase n=1 Tax=Micrococcoides hystricis TaxID=1572761 RepID=A0ABV6P713_9MICC